MPPGPNTGLGRPQGCCLPRVSNATSLWMADAHFMQEAAHASSRMAGGPDCWVLQASTITAGKHNMIIIVDISIILQHQQVKVTKRTAVFFRQPCLARTAWAPLHEEQVVQLQLPLPCITSHHITSLMLPDIRGQSYLFTFPTAPPWHCANSKPTQVRPLQTESHK